VIDDAQAAENELAGVGGLPEPMERYIANAIAFGVAFVDVGATGGKTFYRSSSEKMMGY
jgi:hypothetical protein